MYFVCELQNLSRFNDSNIIVKLVLFYFLGGRFKKEVIIDGQSYLLLIRDEGGSPEMQVGFENLDVSFLSLFFFGLNWYILICNIIDSVCYHDPLRVGEVVSAASISQDKKTFRNYVEIGSAASIPQEKKRQKDGLKTIYTCRDKL